jgi:hypothetical protein
MIDPSARIIEGPWDEDCDLPVLLEPGKYQAVYVRHEFHPKIFDRACVVAEFRIVSLGDGFGCVLNYYWNVIGTGKRRWTCKKHSKLATDIARLYPWFRRPCKALQGTLGDLLSNRIFEVQVETVTTDNRQQPLEVGYSKIDRLMAVVEEPRGGV